MPARRSIKRSTKAKDAKSTRSARLRPGTQRKSSYLEEHRIDFIDYKDVKLLQRFLSPQGKILPRRLTRLTPAQQHAATRAIKKARHLALLPFKSDAEAY
jgi:small subunit ribosomal protein S18